MMLSFLNSYLLILTVIGLNVPASSNAKFSSIRLKTRPVGISICLYRVGTANNIQELSNLEKHIDKANCVNLYKITEDLAIIFMDTNDPYSNMGALPYKMLFGNVVKKQAGDLMINGFIPTEEVARICAWIRKTRIDNFDGFSEMYDKLSKDSKQQLEDIGADDKKSLFTGYVEPLTEFYFAALREKNSIVICVE